MTIACRASVRGPEGEEAARVDDGRRLHWSMLTEAEREGYGVLVAHFFGLDSLDSEWRMNFSLSQAARLENLVDPVGLLTDLTKAFWQGGRRLLSLVQQLAEVEIVEVDILHEIVLRHGGKETLCLPTYSSYFYYFQRLLKEYGCMTVDWNSFPHPPWRVDFERLEVDVALMSRLREMRMAGEMPDRSLFARGEPSLAEDK